jgi:hypothetical protein
MFLENMLPLRLYAAAFWYGACIWLLQWRYCHPIQLGSCAPLCFDLASVGPGLSMPTKSPWGSWAPSMTRVRTHRAVSVTESMLVTEAV